MGDHGHLTAPGQYGSSTVRDQILGLVAGSPVALGEAVLAPAAVETTSGVRRPARRRPLKRQHPT